jgi:hypothetical protein
MKEFYHAFRVFSEVIGTIQGVVVIVSFVISLIRKKNPFEIENDIRLGKALSVLSILLSFFVFVFYFKFVKPSSYLNNFQLDVVYIVLGGFVTLFVASMATIVSFFLLMYMYKIIEENGDWSDFTDLSNNNTSIGLIRLILNPFIVLILIFSNYFTSSMIFRCGFGKVQWLIGPFIPIFLLIGFLIIKNHYENYY